jgi:hypothetical protein
MSNRKDTILEIMYRLDIEVDSAKGKPVIKSLGRCSTESLDIILNSIVNL